MDLYFVRLSLS